MNVTDIEKISIGLLSKIPEFQKDKLYISFSPTKIDCRPYIQVNDNGYHYYCYERGKCVTDKCTFNIKDAIFWVLDSYIWGESYEYEFYHRVRYTDSRRLSFSTSQRLYSWIGNPYSAMNDNKINDILMRVPFDNTNTIKLDLVDDFERVAKKLRNASNLGEEYSNLCNNHIEIFINRVYRSQYGGIANLEHIFEKLLESFFAIRNELHLKKIYCEEIVNIIDTIYCIEKVVEQAFVNNFNPKL